MTLSTPPQPAAAGRGVVRKLGWLTVALVIILDQVTKLVSLSRLELHQVHPVMPGFNLFLTRNTGVSFSFLQGLPAWVLILLNLAIIGVVAWVWLRDSHTGRLHTIAFAAIVGGAVGNIIDRIRLGYVVDFISVYALDWYFSVFNIADAAISIGAVLLIFELIVYPNRSSK
jgi:signal peptidase II